MSHQVQTIDDAHAIRHCKYRRIIPGPNQQGGEQAAPPPAFVATDPTLQTWFQHTWDQIVANYRMQLQEQMMTPPEFQTFTNWPGDMPHFARGDGNADDDIDVTAADTFMDEGEGDTRDEDVPSD
ncbi:hypothetical protein TSUD_322760 [Trifolium subterraneum]|uniref:Uncharacterized protein n=1 Tax=Trifolium subterraneum TaxID=3900 RepID=A0A2Z6M1J9_TRISU|nr:hypothetical protein TSUD_322760 [Trifolium subterraneum]